jgi:hypothetical protein
MAGGLAGQTANFHDFPSVVKRYTICLPAAAELRVLTPDSALADIENDKSKKER